MAEVMPSHLRHLVSPDGNVDVRGLLPSDFTSLLPRGAMRGGAAMSDVMRVDPDGLRGAEPAFDTLAPRSTGCCPGSPRR